jgi:hypothetical protein
MPNWPTDDVVREDTGCTWRWERFMRTLADEAGSMCRKQNGEELALKERFCVDRRRGYERGRWSGPQAQGLRLTRLR